MDTETLPERINVTYVTTYGVEELIAQLRSDNRDIHGEMTFTLEDILSYVENEAIDLIREARVRDLIFTDENGEEL